MKNIVKNISLDELKVLDKERVEYTILNIDHKNGCDVYEIRIDGDEQYYNMVLHALRK